VFFPDQVPGKLSAHKPRPYNDNPHVFYAKKSIGRIMIYLQYLKKTALLPRVYPVKAYTGDAAFSEGHLHLYKFCTKFVDNPKKVV
jgi:hypothetical protein